MRALLRSFRYALDGLAYALVTQRNMRLHFAAAFVVVILCAVLQVDAFEILSVLSAITLVMALELVNTSIEQVVDLLTQEHRRAAKIAKDVAAAAVFVAAVNAVVVAYLVFYNKLDPARWRAPASLVQAPYPGVLLVGAILLIVTTVAHALRTRQVKRGD